MISYYYSTKNTEPLVVLSEFKKNSWIHVDQPTKTEIEHLISEYSLDQGLLHDALDPYEVPRVETDDKVTYFYTRAPFKEDNHVFTSPVVVVVAENFIMTIVQRKLSIWDRFVEGQTTIPTTEKTKFFFQIFSEVAANYTRLVNEVRRDVQRSTVRFGSIGNREIIQFVGFENTLNNFLSALVPTNASLTNFLNGNHITLHEDDREFAEDILLSNQQLIEVCKNNLQAISNIRGAYSTVMTNNLNRVIKLLTVLTIILTIPTMISSFFGMNVQLPGGSSPVAFWAIVGLTAGAVVMALLVFYYKDWLR